MQTIAIGAHLGSLKIHKMISNHHVGKKQSVMGTAATIFRAFHAMSSHELYQCLQLSLGYGLPFHLQLSQRKCWWVTASVWRFNIRFKKEIYKNGKKLFN